MYALDLRSFVALTTLAAVLSGVPMACVDEDPPPPPPTPAPMGCLVQFDPRAEGWDVYDDQRWYPDVDFWPYTLRCMGPEYTQTLWYSPTNLGHLRSPLPGTSIEDWLSNINFSYELGAGEVLSGVNQGLSMWNAVVGSELTLTTGAWFNHPTAPASQPFPQFANDEYSVLRVEDGPSLTLGAVAGASNAPVDATLITGDVVLFVYQALAQDIVSNGSTLAEAGELMLIPWSGQSTEDFEASLANVVTHEAGHVVGFDHNADVFSIMNEIVEIDSPPFDGSTDNALVLSDRTAYAWLY
jgi:hypothetical protein